MSQNLPGIFENKMDNGLSILATSNAPKILVLGTAGSGISENVYPVGRVQDAATEFGSSGTLVRGMYEVKAANPGANILLFRIGATSAILEGIGVTAKTGGISITTNVKDDTAGDQYSFYWDNSTKKLSIKNVAADTVIYERTFSSLLPTIDLGEVSVTGTYTLAEGVSIGSSGSYLTLAAAAASTSPDFAVTITAGTDGTNLSRMRLFECLYEAYDLLENEDFAEVVPMDVYLDDANAVDGDLYNGTPPVYPTANTPDDILLYFYTEEYLGVRYYWWRENKAAGAADISPASYPTTTPNGTVITTLAFHEVNFTYQLADFCYRISADHNECLGFAMVKPPNSTGLKDVALWLGKKPVYTTVAGVSVIASAPSDGVGLLGNKFLAGKFGFRANVAYGGFIATEEGFVDGTEVEDEGGSKIDIGAYLSICGQWVRVYNGFDTTGLGYITNLATTYAGFVSSLDAKSSPTNKVLAGVSLPFRIGNTKLDDLVDMRYIFCQIKSKGIIIADAPTAARPNSDYRRLTTVRICKLVVDGIRQAGDPFIGNTMGDPERAALDTALEGVFTKCREGKYITRAEKVIIQSAAQRVNGEARVELTLVPAWELRRITLVISLRPI